MPRLTPAQLIRQLQSVDPDAAVVRLRLLVDALRPRRERMEEEDADADFRTRLQAIAAMLEQQPAVAGSLREGIGGWLGRQNLVMALSHGGLLPRRGFLAELIRRGYDTVNPPAADAHDLSASLRKVFHRRDDHVWVEEVGDDAWLEFFALLMGGQASRPNLPDSWREQALDALEKLAVWVAAEELEGELVRLDPKILERQSPFSALQREISLHVTADRAHAAGERAEYHDDAHAQVLLEQSVKALAHYRKRSLALGASVGLTYLLERLEQTLQRIGTLLRLVDRNPSEPGSVRQAGMQLFRSLVGAAVQRNSVRALWRQATGLLARKVSGNAGKHGEHYISHDRRGYLKMLASAAGAGLLVPLMAIIKLKIEVAGLPPLFNALMQSLNYGFGFMLIHMLGFTIATKQPAMTASHIAAAMERDNRSRAKPDALIELAAQVARTQFVAIVGNVGVALAVSLLIAWGYQHFQGHAMIVPGKARALLASLHPFAGLALLHAAIAGVWLFCAGLIAGWFENRFDRLGLRERFIQHPFWRRVLPTRLRVRFADWLAAHYGALWGNFLFGVLLGSTGFFGMLVGLPIDIRHVTFSAANLGFSGGLVWLDFLVYLGFVLLIGAVNLAVSFSLALMVGLRARGLKVPDPLRILRALWGKLMVAPWEFVLPPLQGKPKPAEEPPKTSG